MRTSRPRITTKKWPRPVAPLLRIRLAMLVASVALITSVAPAQTQQAANQPPDYSRGEGWFPLSLKPFRLRPVPAPSLQNSAALQGLLTNGSIPLSVSQLDSAVVANNLTIESARYTVSLAATDLLKARSGQVPSGTNAAAIPPALGSVSFGSTASGSANFRARAVTVGPRGSFDPALNFNFSIDQSTDISNNTTVNGIASVITHSNVFQAGYVQAFTTGTSFSLNWNIQRQTSTSARSRFNPSLSSNYNLSINQQLFSGFGFAMNRRYQTVAETNRQSARQYYRLQVITQLVAAENQYWDLVAAKEQVRTAQQALTVSEQLLSDNRKQAQIGTLAPLDVVSAESEVAGRRRDLIIAQTAEQLAELKLKNILARQLDDTLAAAAVQTTDALPEPKPADQPAFEEALTMAMRSRPELLLAEGNIRNQDVAVKYTEKRLKPTLSIFGVLSSQARGGHLLDRDGNVIEVVGLPDILSQVGQMNFPEYAFGFSLTIPIGNRSAQADHTKALLRRQQMDGSLQRTRDQIRLEVRNAIIGLEQAKAQIAAAHMAVSLSQQKLDAEQKKLRAGTSTSYNVILAQRDLLDAELAEVQAKVGYAKARVEMDRSMGTLLQKRGIDLDRTIAGR